MIAAVPVFSQQTVEYEYDVAGNRISRNVIVLYTNTRGVLAQPQPQDSVVYKESLKDFSVRIYPNPTDGLLTVELHNLPEKQTAVISLYNTSGKQLLLQRNVEYSTEVNLSNQPQGIYILRIEISGNVSEWKIIKR
jgi:hypothetical protein